MTNSTTNGFGVVVLDLDGTLVDSSADIADAMNHALSAHGIGAVTAEQVGAALGGGPTILVERCLTAAGWAADDPALVASVLEAYSDRYRAHPATHTRVFDTAEAVLPALHARGVLIGVCTNKRTAIAEAVLDAVGLSSIVGAVVGSDATPTPKPQPGHLTDTIAALGATDRPALYVGDTDIDQRTAAAAGVTYAHVEWGHHGIAADFHLRSFDDLLTII
jgi:phosphoglycolate phosphatase